MDEELIYKIEKEGCYRFNSPFYPDIEESVNWFKSQFDNIISDSGKKFNFELNNQKYRCVIIPNYRELVAYFDKI